MGTIYATSPNTGKVYPVSIAGSDPTPEEKAKILTEMARREGFLQTEKPELIEEDTVGGIGDLIQGTAYGFGNSFAQIPGGLASLTEAVLPGDQSGLERAGQSITDALQSGVEYVVGTPDDNIMSKSGQAIGSLASFLVPAAGGMKLASAAGAGVTATRLAGTAAAGAMGVSLGAQNQYERIGRALEEGKDVDSKRLAILFGGAIGATEAVPVGRVFGAIANILKKVPKDAKQEAVKTIRGRLKSAGLAGLVEGGQEVTAAILQDVTERGLYNPDLEIAASAYKDDAIYGGGAGATFNFLLETIAGRRVKKFLKGQAQLVADQQEEGVEAAEMAGRGRASMDGRRFDADGNEIPEGQLAIEAPRLALPSPELADQPDTPSETLEKRKQVKENILGLGLNPDKERQVGIQAAKEALAGKFEVELDELPDAEAQIIRMSRQRNGQPDIDKPAPLSEIESVLGIEAYNRANLKLNPATADKKLTAEEKEELKEQKEFEQEVSKSREAAILAVESGVAVRKDGAVSKKKLKEALKVRDNIAVGIIEDLTKRGVITPISPTEFKVVNPAKEPTPPSPEEVAAKQREDNLLELQKQKLDAEKELDKIKKQGVQTPEQQRELETAQEKVDGYSRAIDARRDISPPPSEQNSALQLRANDARKAAEEATQPTPEYSRKKQRVANALRKLLFKMGLTDVELVTTNVIPADNLSLAEGTFEQTEDGKRIITLAMDLYDPNMSDAELEQRLAAVMNHEVIHAIKNLGLLTEQEYQILVKAAEKRKYVKDIKGAKREREYTFLDRAEYMYPDADPELQQEEAVAEMFRAYAEGKLRLGGKPKTLFGRIVNFFKSIFTAHKEAGFNQAAEIFEGIKSGKIGRRNRNINLARQALNETRYSTAGVRAGFLIPERGNIERIEQSFKDVTKRIPELTDAANKLSEGEINYEQYDKLVNEFKPIIPYETVPAPETTEDMLNALQASDPRKVQKLGQAVNIENGTRVKLRLDIPAYTRQGVWIPTIHGQDNRTIAHESTAIITNATFSASQKVAERIAVGGQKGPFATIDGSFFKASPDEAFAFAQQMMSDPDVVQVGFDPERHSYFYDRMTTQPVIAADFVVQIGPLVLARNPKFGAKSGFRYSIRRLDNLPPNLIGPIPQVVDAKTRYLQSVDMPNRRQSVYVEVYKDLAGRIATAFEEAKDNPTDPETLAAYNAMAEETLAQWQFVKDTGVQIEFIRLDQENPYPNGSRDVLIDIRDNNHLWVFPTDDGFGQEAITEADEAANPLLKRANEVVDGVDMRINDVFRIVHDYFGHGLEGSTFTARGEENAWQAHVRMYTPLAARAMTTETRGQNSWVNFGPMGEQNRANPSDTVYAEQKITLLPDFVVEEGVAPDMESNSDVKNARESRRNYPSGTVGPNTRAGTRIRDGQAGVGGEVSESEESDFEVTKPRTDEKGLTRLVHYSKEGAINVVEPERQGTNYNAKGEEYTRRVSFPNDFQARSYYGLNVGYPEGYRKEWLAGENAYETFIPVDGLYDFIEDPDGFKAKAEAMVTDKVREISIENINNPELYINQFVVTQTEKMIKDAGYVGYFAKADYGMAAAVFNRLSVSPVGKKSSEVKESRRNLPGGYADILPYMLEDEIELTETGMRHHVNQRIQDIVNIFTEIPSAEEMSSVAVAGRAKKGWYRNSAQAIQDFFGLYDARRFTALLAATSPMTSVESNAINTLNTWVNWNKSGRPKDEESIMRILGESVQGDKGTESVLPAWVNNSIRALSAPEGTEMSLQLSGPKVNSFMLNLVGAVDEVTNDTWMANYALIDQERFKGVERKAFSDEIGQLGVKSSGYIGFSAKVRQAAEAASQITGDQWSPAEIQETVWSVSKAIVERRRSEGSSGLSATDLLKQGLITDVDVADVPDFATLFSNGAYKKILEEGGYERQVEDVRSRAESNERTVEQRPIYGAEDLSIAPSAFRRELDEFSERLETLVRRESVRRFSQAQVIDVPKTAQPPIAQATAEVEEFIDRVTYNNTANVLSKFLGKFVGDEKSEVIRARSERFLTKFQDAMLPVGKLMDELRADGYKVSDALDVYMREELSQGLIGAKLDENRENLFEPIGENIRDVSLSDAQYKTLDVISGFFRDARAKETYTDQLAAVEAFLYAKHAIERNRYVQDKFNRGMGSGMSNEEAKAIIDWVDTLDLESRATFNRIAGIVSKVIESTNEERRRGGLIVSEYEFDFYVPLRGLLDVDEEIEQDASNLPRITSRRYQNLYGGRIAQDPRIRQGRGTQYAENIIANVMNQNQRTIVDAERNLVGQSFLNLVQDKDINTTGIAEVLTEYDPELENNILRVKIGGQKERVNVLIFDDRIARAMKGAYGDGISRGGWVVDKLGKFNRFLSSINTTYNPSFTIPNFFRDLETAGVNVAQYENQPPMTKEVMKNALPAVRGILGKLRADDFEKYGRTKWTESFEAFVKAGGKNSTNQVDSVEDQMRNLKGLLDDITGTGIKNKLGLNKIGFNKLLKFLDDYNTAIENGVRVATFQALKDRGIPEARAAQAARNVTVNFAKAGEEKKLMNALYLFYNASLQGSFALMNAAVRSKNVRKIWAGLLLSGILMDQFNAAISGDEDDDGQKDYDELIDYHLEHNIIIPTFGVAGDEKFIKIPLAYGLNMATNFGRVLSRYSRGEYSSGQAFNSAMGTFLDAISPFGGINDFSEPVDYATLVSPEVLDPAVELLANRNFKGVPIYKEGSPFGVQRPDSQKYWANTSTTAKTISNALNSIGGTEITPGLIDVSPNILEYWGNYFTGGAGAFALRTAELPKNIVDALRGDFEGDVVKEIPFIRRLYISPSTQEDTSAFMQLRDDVYRAVEELKFARQGGDEARVREVMLKYREELSVAGQIRALNNFRNKLLRQKNKINRSPVVPENQKRVLIKNINERISAVVKDANKIMRDAGLIK